jgi:hypothetical protein
MSEAESLSDFLKRMAEESPEPLLAILREKAAARGLKGFDASAELARMKAYISHYYEGVRPVSSLLLGDGHVVDFIPFAQQPAARSAREAGSELLTAPPPPAPGPGAEPTQAAAPVPAHAGMSGPPGTVAVPRVTLEQLVSSGTLENFFRKTRP